jgi:hypothetical protein
MPALNNQRQERFCQLVKQGIPKLRAYEMAGYAPNHGAPYRLAENVSVKRRMSELTRGLAMKTQVTVQSVTEELDAIAVGAAKSEQWGAAKSAVEAKAKLHGLLIDRKESGAPGDFDGLKTESEVVDAFRTAHGEEAAQLLVKLLAGRDKPAEAAPAPAQAKLPKPGETMN